MAPEMHPEITAWLFGQTVLNTDPSSSFDSQEALASKTVVTGKAAAQSRTQRPPETTQYRVGGEVDEVAIPANARQSSSVLSIQEAGHPHSNDTRFEIPCAVAQSEAPFFGEGEMWCRRVHADTEETGEQHDFALYASDCPFRIANADETAVSVASPPSWTPSFQSAVDSQRSSSYRMQTSPSEAIRTQIDGSCI